MRDKNQKGKAFHISNQYNWKNYSEPNKSIMKAQLERISSLDNLAKDVTEIVTKALQT